LYKTHLPTLVTMVLLFSNMISKHRSFSSYNYYSIKNFWMAAFYFLDNPDPVERETISNPNTRPDWTPKSESCIPLLTTHIQFQADCDVGLAKPCKNVITVKYSSRFCCFRSAKRVPHTTIGKAQNSEAKRYVPSLLV